MPLLKCGVADRYMKQGGDENRQMALKLLEGSAKEGFESWLRCRLLAARSASAPYRFGAIGDCS